MTQTSGELALPFRTHCRAARPCVRPTSPLSHRACGAGRVGAPPRGPLGGLGAPRPAPRIPGPGGERGGRPARERRWLRAGRPRSAESGGGAWPGRRRSPTPWPFCAATLPEPFREPRLPAPLPRQSLRPRAERGGGTPRAAPPPASGNLSLSGGGVGWFSGTCVPEGSGSLGPSAIAPSW